jgi:hypothetical protein
MMGLIAATANLIFYYGDYLVSINDIKKVAELEHIEPDKYTRINMAIDQVKVWVDESRLNVYDASSGTSFESIYGLVGAVSSKDDTAEWITFIDNFYDIDGSSSEEGMKILLKKFKHKLIASYDIPFITTMEMRKQSNIGRNRKPVLGDIRDTSKIAYALDLSLMIHNDQHMNPSSHMVFRYNNENRPVVEMSVNKNKLTEFKGTLLFKFYTFASKMEEITIGSEDYEAYRQLARTDTKRADASKVKMYHTEENTQNGDNVSQSSRAAVSLPSSMKNRMDDEIITPNDPRYFPSSGTEDTIINEPAEIQQLVQESNDGTVIDTLPD